MIGLIKTKRFIPLDFYAPDTSHYPNLRLWYSFNQKYLANRLLIEITQCFRVSNKVILTQIPTIERVTANFIPLVPDISSSDWLHTLTQYLFLFVELKSRYFGFIYFLIVSLVECSNIFELPTREQFKE